VGNSINKETVSHRLLFLLWILVYHTQLTIQHSNTAVQCSTHSTDTQYSTVEYSTVQLCDQWVTDCVSYRLLLMLWILMYHTQLTIQHSNTTVECSTHSTDTQYSTVQYSTVQYSCVINGSLTACLIGCCLCCGSSCITLS